MFREKWFGERWFGERWLVAVFSYRGFSPLLWAAIVIMAALPFWAVSDSVIPANAIEELPAGTMQAKATTSCLACHEARIILQQRLSKAAWTREIDKMVKWGAAVDAADHDALVDYLSTNFSPDKPPYEPARTATEKAGSRQSEKPSKQ
jgi:mono/diheme cytochrome c family protein